MRKHEKVSETGWTVEEAVKLPRLVNLNSILRVQQASVKESRVIRKAVALIRDVATNDTRRTA